MGRDRQLPEIGVVAAAERGVNLDRIALVPNSGAEVVAAVSALIDGFDLVVLGFAAARGIRPKSPAEARSCWPLGTWPGTDLELRVSKRWWHGATDAPVL
jgi:hypothetical protein